VCQFQIAACVNLHPLLTQLDWISATGSPQALLGIDLNADGRLQTSELLSSNLNWLDANHNGRIEPNDPAYYAIRVWLDVNGDGDSRTLLGTSTDSNGRPTVNLRDETISLAIAGVTAIDFRGTNAKNGQGTYTPHVERGDGTVPASRLCSRKRAGHRASSRCSTRKCIAQIDSCSRTFVYGLKLISSIEIAMKASKTVKTRLPA
jgi:hypothetical protein